MTLDPSNFARMQHARLRAQADLFAAVASHGTIVGTAREIALIDFFRGLVPKRFEVLSGAIVNSAGGAIAKATRQLDVMVVDTFEYPTLLRAGDLALAVPESVRIVVESKSDLQKGESFWDALEQIGQARLMTASGAFTALFCFGSPTKSSTLREWLSEVPTYRQRLLEWASLEPGKPAKDGSKRPKRYEKSDETMLHEVASNISAASLPDLVVADDGAIAMRSDLDGKTRYDFFVTKDGAPSVVALASKVLAHVSPPATSTGKPDGYKLLIDHYDAAIAPAELEPLDLTDPQPKVT